MIKIGIFSLDSHERMKAPCRKIQGTRLPCLPAHDS
jgi:hypothetical protein